MEKLSLNEIRKRFLDFFESKDHFVEPSFSLVPQNDKSLLLINAGMVPLKNYFMGLETPPAVRMSTCQKCIRTGDIENVGRTSRHATFFEMLGNFSFGDYFKEQSLLWGWEFITENLGLSTDRLWASVYEEDDEAYEIWEKKIGLPASRIVRLGKADNFWEIGTGPCGPCSEIYFDRGEKYGCDDPGCKPGCDCDRYIEFWNHVFTQFDKDEEGNYNALRKKNIDTGMGLERISCIMQDVDSIYDIDTNRFILEAVNERSAKKYLTSDKSDVSIRIITDHIKAVTFLVCDGVLPNNEGRGYVLRRLLRRAARHGKLLGIEGNFLSELVESVVKMYGGAYPDLEKRYDYIVRVISLEEERFQATIDNGLNILATFIDETIDAGDRVLSGRKAFTLYDTYGFPLDLTIEILDEKGLSVNESEFEEAMKEQKDTARRSRGKTDDLGWEADAASSLSLEYATDFMGYDNIHCEASIVGLIVDNESVSMAHEGDDVLVVLDRTPFYAEGGGQVGDIGTLEGKTFSIRVDDTKKTPNGIFIHHGKVTKGSVEVSNFVDAKVDEANRLNVCRNHTSTHLLQKALKTVLGDHVEQSGSYVDTGKLRFDFTHFEAMSEDEIRRAEDIVNEQILMPFAIETFYSDIESARKMGAMALFGEKYGNTVRVVKAGDFSIELCGGTHVSKTSDIGLFKIVSETGVAAGVRRIEAVTGRSVLQMLNSLQDKVQSVSQIVKSTAGEVENRAAQLMSENRLMSKELQSIKSKMAFESSKSLVDGAVDVKGTKLIASRVENGDIETLKQLGDNLKESVSDVVVALAVEADGKAVFLVMADDAAVRKGAHAGNLIKEMAKIAEGGGGGKPQMAQAGGKNPAKIGEALEKSIEVLNGMIK